MIITKHMNFRVSGQKINTTTSVKYLGVYLSDSLTWETHFKNLIPTSHLTYASQIWRQIKTKLFQEVVKLQNKAIQIMNFLPFNNNSSNINKTYNDLKILKLPGFIWLQKQLICERLLWKRNSQPIYQLLSKIRVSTFP